MRIERVESLLASIPLRRPVHLAKETFTARVFNVVRVRTDEGVVGVGYARGGRLVDAAVRLEVAPRVEGSRLATDVLWKRVWEGTALVRGGATARALAAVDIALWDVRAKVAGLPLFRLLGGRRGAVDAYVSGGYYRDGQSADDLAREMAGYVERGWPALKIRVGRLPVAEDAARVAAVRRAIGDGVLLAVDANQGYGTAAEAIEAGRAFAEHGVRWLEEPLPPHEAAAAAQVAEALELPVAAGEVLHDRFAFRDLIERRAADILQPDVTVCAGVSEWLRIAEAAAQAGLPVAPHYFTEVHAHLVAAVDGLTVECFEPDADIISFDPLLAQPLRPREGRIELPETPGAGLDLDEDALARYRVEAAP